MKKILCFLFVTIVLLSQSACCGNSIVGTWTVESFEMDGERIAFDALGTDFAKAADAELLFQASGYVKVYVPMGEDRAIDNTVRYTVTDNTIELYNDSEHLDYLEIDGNTIRLAMSDDLFIIFRK